MTIDGDKTKPPCVILFRRVVLYSYAVFLSFVLDVVLSVFVLS